jgi:hypothetical protein
MRALVIFTILVALLVVWRATDIIAHIALPGLP